MVEGHHFFCLDFLCFYTKSQEKSDCGKGNITFNVWISDSAVVLITILKGGRSFLIVEGQDCFTRSDLTRQIVLQVPYQTVNVRYIGINLFYMSHPNLFPGISL